MILYQCDVCKKISQDDDLSKMFGKAEAGQKLYEQRFVYGGLPITITAHINREGDPLRRILICDECFGKTAQAIGIKVDVWL